QTPIVSTKPETNLMDFDQEYIQTNSPSVGLVIPKLNCSPITNMSLSYKPIDCRVQSLFSNEKFSGSTFKDTMGM
ncbi:hypothetical protein, partial [Corallococcus caeni]|uniref:hypothetical protein n=1 Tax=Corallococcus caeni TaxID=3082388 RepID=UPI0030C710CB